MLSGGHGGLAYASLIARNSFAGERLAMANRRPDYRVLVSRPGKSESEQYYTEVGAAWKVSNDGISIKLHPNLTVSGSLVLFPPKADD